jgi:hypothetical protein
MGDADIVYARPGRIRGSAPRLAQLTRSRTKAVTGAASVSHILMALAGAGARGSRRERLVCATERY